MNTHTPGRHAIACILLACTLAACSNAPKNTLSLPDAVPKELGEFGAGEAGASESGGVLGYIGNLGKKALEATGLKKPEAPELPKVPDRALPDHRIAWRIHASTSLNVTERGQSLALLTRLYRLRSPDAFLQAPPDTFGDAAKEKDVLGDDLVSVREVQLIPGQQYETTEKVPRDVRYVGIVGMFRSPASNRWRYAFSSATAELSGLTLGAHACAMSVQTGEPIGQPVKVVRSAAVTCP
ncbi:MAG: type VI secretion system lipoprotein TssJ [Aquabacterium sp.]|jgi:type VI secretion system protein VasD|uniref:type VI secretion system lipoprotein TssJ n=1 Tax=Aquabacterium sp. TaxID=1872578 RepID=UPI001B6CB173|nr:type VI secretion system lipoprotein TssJ [Aquabacterium sp.]MBP7132884.1 type VI secretion system lipoprotein TssJ [Aquabacterium sp.]MBP9063382.1 type VI secretion system lipoprotein TssJ [Aquabacterium sp.]